MSENAITRGIFNVPAFFILTTKILLFLQFLVSVNEKKTRSKQEIIDLLSFIQSHLNEWVPICRSHNQTLLFSLSTNIIDTSIA